MREKTDAVWRISLRFVVAGSGRSGMNWADGLSPLREIRTGKVTRDETGVTRRGEMV
jgi:hypothetical protein